MFIFDLAGLDVVRTISSEFEHSLTDVELFWRVSMPKVQQIWSFSRACSGRQQNIVRNITGVGSSVVTESTVRDNQHSHTLNGLLPLFFWGGGFSRAQYDQSHIHYRFNVRQLT